MTQPPRLTQAQKDRLEKLEPRLRKLAQIGHYSDAKEVFLEINKILKPTGHDTRLLKARNYLFESALETGKSDDLEMAISGFSGVHQKAGDKTRIWLEATAFLGICYLRKN